MRPKDLYKCPPISVTKECYALSRHIVDVDSCVDWEKNKYVELRHYANECFDGRRGWELFSVWFKHKPVMICQAAGRENDDHTDEFITHAKRYVQMKQYIMSISESGDEEEVDEVSVVADDPTITKFYNCELSQFYNPDGVKPKYKIGDTVIAMVPENHLHYDSKMVKARVKIERVARFNPTETYWGNQIDRGWKHNKNGSQKMVTMVGKGGVGATFNDDKILGYARWVGKNLKETSKILEVLE